MDRSWLVQCARRLPRPAPTDETGLHDRAVGHRAASGGWRDMAPETAAGGSGRRRPLVIDAEAGLAHADQGRGPHPSLLARQGDNLLLRQRPAVEPDIRQRAGEVGQAAEPDAQGCCRRQVEHPVGQVH